MVVLEIVIQKLVKFLLTGIFKILIIVVLRVILLGIAIDR